MLTVLVAFGIVSIVSSVLVVAACMVSAKISYQEETVEVLENQPELPRRAVPQSSSA